jgi:hypothetical protein
MPARCPPHPAPPARRPPAPPGPWNHSSNAAAVLTGFEPAIFCLTGRRGRPNSPTGPCDLRSGGWGRTSVSGLTVRRPAIERHQNEVPRFAVHYRPWRTACLRGGGGIRTRVFTAYEAGLVPNSSPLRCDPPGARTRTLLLERQVALTTLPSGPWVLRARLELAVSRLRA